MRKQDVCGTFTRYKVGGCRCAECTEAHRVYAADRRRQLAYGRWDPFVDAAPVRAHVEDLKQAGLGRRQISELADVDQCMIHRLERGLRGRPPTKRMRKATAERILSVRPGLDSLADCALVDATGTHRRLQALVANGWTLAEIARRLGVLPTNMSTMMRRRNVIASKARAVRDLYDQMWDQAPPSSTPYERAAVTQALRLAAERAWVRPLAWDEGAIDDPGALPARSDASAGLVDEIAVELALGGDQVRLSRAEVAEVVRLGTERGMSAAEIAEVTGRSTRSVQRRRAA